MGPKVPNIVSPGQVGPTFAVPEPNPWASTRRTTPVRVLFVIAVSL